jgi:hypothetical protein
MFIVACSLSRITDALVKNFAEKDAANYGHSPLPELMREMEKMPRK